MRKMNRINNLAILDILESVVITETTIDANLENGAVSSMLRKMKLVIKK